MNTPLTLPEDWTYREDLIDRGYVCAHNTSLDVVVVHWVSKPEDRHLEKYLLRSSQHKLMFRLSMGADYQPVPDSIETLQEAINYVYVISRMEPHNE